MGDVVIGPQLALSKSILDVFVMMDVYEDSAALEDAVLALISTVNEDEAAVLTDSYGDVLRHLEQDLLRWRVAGDLSVRLDMYEVSGILLSGLQRQPDVHQAGNLAALAVNPSVTMAFYTKVLDYLSSLDLPEPIARLLQVRLGKETAGSEWERRIDIQMWPGRNSVAALKTVAPIVYIASGADSMAALWQCAAALARAGGRVRRLPDSIDAIGSTPWASKDYPIVHWSGTELAVWHRLTGSSSTPARQVLAPARSDGVLDAGRLVNRVQEAMGSQSSSLRRPPGLESLPQPFDPDTLHAGAYDAHEMAYLGATSRTTLQRLAKTGFDPIEADVMRWSFRQLVAVRLIQGFRSNGLRYRRQPQTLVQQLSDIAAASLKHRVGLGGDGDVYIDDGNGFVNIRTGQQALEEVLAIDDAFRPFVLGAGQVPDLLRPGRHTTVHPLTLGGTPCVENKRVAARSLAAAAHRSRDEKILRSAYPELLPAELADAVSIGDQIRLVSVA